MFTSSSRVTAIYGACVAIVAIDASKHTSSLRVTSIDGAHIVVVTYSGSIDTVGCDRITFPRDTTVT